MHEHEKQIPIWFFIGFLLAIYGVLIVGAGIYDWVHPPEHKLALWELHSDVWWGGLLTIFGLFYVVRYWPTRKGETLTGKS